MLALANHILRYMPNRQADEHAVLIFDGATMHYNVAFLEHLRKHRVHCFPIGAHLTHLLSPLDLAVFAAYKRRMRAFTRKDGVIVRQAGWERELLARADAAWRHATASDTVLSGWTQSGFYSNEPQREIIIARLRSGPFNPTANDTTVEEPQQLPEARELMAKYEVEQLLRSRVVVKAQPRQRRARTNPVNIDITSTGALSMLRARDIARNHVKKIKGKHGSRVKRLLGAGTALHTPRHPSTSRRSSTRATATAAPDSTLLSRSLSSQSDASLSDDRVGDEPSADASASASTLFRPRPVRRNDSDYVFY
jgi:hypothetical protein